MTHVSLVSHERLSDVVAQVIDASNLHVINTSGISHVSGVINRGG